jgi:hypothetical protein
LNEIEKNKDVKYYNTPDGKLIKSVFKEFNVQNIAEKQINNDILLIYKLKLKLQKAVSPLKSVVYYQNNYSNHVMQIKDMATNFSEINFIKIFKNIFNTTITEEDYVFIPDIEYIRKIGKIIKSEDKK